MPDGPALEESRSHIFDIARDSGSNDPSEITRRFLAPENRDRHVPLETVRRYYSQVSYWLGRGAFNLGAEITHSPTGAVVFFQLASALAMAVSFALLLTSAVISLTGDEGRKFRLFMIVLVFLTIASEPVILSLSRQMLTETAGFMMLVPAVLLFRSAVLPTRRTVTASIFTACSAVFLFLTLRTRYTLGPSAFLLLPLVLLLTAPPSTLLRRWRCFALLAFAGIGVFGALVAIDVHWNGPFILPWVYDDALVRSTRLYFHTDPPYEPFWVMVYVNLPLLILPVLGVAAWIMSPTRGPFHFAAIYAATLLLALLFPIALMARQQVSYQPRHLFAFSAVYICVLLLALPHIRWRLFTAMPFVAICLLVLIANIYSVTGPQRTTMAIPWPNTIAGILNDRSNSGPHANIWKDLANGYFDWSDNQRVRDYLIVFRYLQREKQSLLIIDSNVVGSGAYGVLVTRFRQPFIWWHTGPGPHATELSQIRSALDSGVAVYLTTATGEPTLIHQAFNVQPTRAALNNATLLRVFNNPKPDPPQRRKDAEKN